MADRPRPRPKRQRRCPSSIIFHKGRPFDTHGIRCRRMAMPVSRRLTNRFSTDYKRNGIIMYLVDGRWVGPTTYNELNERTSSASNSAQRISRHLREIDASRCLAPLIIHRTRPCGNVTSKRHVPSRGRPRPPLPTGRPRPSVIGFGFPVMPLKPTLLFRFAAHCKQRKVSGPPTNATN